MTRLFMIAGALVAGLWLAACDEPAGTPPANAPNQAEPAPGGGTPAQPGGQTQ